MLDCEGANFSWNSFFSTANIWLCLKLKEWWESYQQFINNGVVGALISGFAVCGVGA